MFCSICGKENLNTANFCVLCGCNIHLSQSGEKKFNSYANEVFTLKKMDLTLLLILITVTAGLYIPVWLLMRANDINKLNSREKVSSDIYILLIMMSILNFLISSIGLLNEKYILFASFFQLAYFITLFIQIFKVRRIVNEHFSKYIGKKMHFDAIQTLILNIYYFQYKINNFL